MSSVGCQYKDATNSRLYTFKHNEKLVGPLEVGDYVVVEDINGFSLVQVKQLNVKPFGLGERFIVQKVDLNRFAEFKSNQAAKLFLEAEIEAEQERLAKKERYDHLASLSPKMHRLIRAYKELE